MLLFWLQGLGWSVGLLGWWWSVERGGRVGECLLLLEEVLWSALVVLLLVGGPFVGVLEGCN